MVLPVPKLDDRTFQDLVNETKKLIPRYCPEWTDHNVSDPGVTLIELFAYMVDVLLYRINRVPERNFLRWLEMLGLRLDPPKSARTDVTFYLSGPQPDTVTIPLGTEVATVRTESQNSISFATDRDLNIYVPTLAQIASSRAEGQFIDYMKVISEGSFDKTGIFQEPPQPADGLYFGFHENLDGHILRFTIDPVPIGAIGVNPNDPPYQWQYWDGIARSWLPMYTELDTTKALNKEGEVIVHVPFGAASTPVNGFQAFWLCCHSTPAERKQANYTRSPRIREVRVESLGGTAPVSQVEHVRHEDVGRSNGVSGQEFRLNYPPVLERRPGETLIVEKEGGNFEEWQEVQDFGDSKPDDRHFTLDSLSGILRLGPTLRDAGGREEQYGAIPPMGRLLSFTNYRTGGGVRGNVGASRITVLKSSIPFVAAVTNNRPATGGEDAESLEQAMIQGPKLLRARSRAVTIDDFEFLAMQATPEVARARCIPPSPDQVSAGNAVSRVLIVPASSHKETVIPPGELRLSTRAQTEVAQYLDARRLITSSIKVEPPVYRFVSVEVDARRRKNIKADELRETVERHLYRLINPVHGGPDGKGWPWERNLFQSEVTALVQGVDGVEYVEAVRFFVADPETGARTAVQGTVTCPPNGLLASFRHVVVVK